MSKHIIMYGVTSGVSSPNMDSFINRVYIKEYLIGYILKEKMCECENEIIEGMLLPNKKPIVM